MKLQIKLRWKIFITLLVFSLAPLLAVASFSHHGIKKLGRNISNNSRKNLTEMTCESLKKTAENYSKIALLSKKSLEFTLNGLAYEAERALAEDPQIPQRVYFAADFDDEATGPPDFAPSPRYWKESKTGGLSPASISMNHPVFFLAPGVLEESVSSDIHRMTRISRKFRDISLEFNKVIYWIYVSLESGVHVSYPGHGGYPEGYDPRQRPWYTGAKDYTDWIFPIADATTNQVTFTACKRIHRPDGSFAGVAALDILITDVLQESELSALWSDKMRSFMVAIKHNLQTGDQGLLILAQKDYLTKAVSWKGLIKIEWLASENKEKLGRIIADLKEGKSGYMELQYSGVDSFWAYAAIDQKTHFLLIVPKSVIMTLPRETTRTVQNFTRKQLHITAAHAFAAMILLTVAGLLGSRMITRPIMKIVRAAKQLSKGDFSVRLDMQTGDERDQVIQAFNEMVPKLQDHLRIYKSLNLATEVQQSLLPQANPKVPGLDIVGKSIYCDETGGDYFDYLEIGVKPSGRISVIVGDVADHGVPSALLMATARALIRQRSASPGKIAEIVSDVNRQLTGDVEHSGQFMTLIYLTIDRPNQKLQWVRAGHDPAILYDPSTDTIEELRGTGIAVGVDETWQYEENERTGLKKGQILMLGTDGIWEARNQKGSMFGKNAVHEIIRQNAEADASTIQAAIIDALTRFQNGADLEDDVTLVVIKIENDL